MKDPDYWMNHYVLETDPSEISRHIKVVGTSFGEISGMIYFENGRDSPNVLISQGSGGHPYVFAELGYQIHLRGYNVFIMPKHGGYTITELMERHSIALKFIRSEFNEKIGVFAEGLGGYVIFYLALAKGELKSAIYQNSPAILTDEKFRDTIIRGRRKRIMPMAKLLLTISPKIKLSISTYLNWKELIDTKEPNRKIESRLVIDGYLNDPDFDKWYPLSAIMSLISTPPPEQLSELKIPTKFMIAERGFGGKPYVEYLDELYRQLPLTKKELISVDGSVYWMLSHPKEATKIICDWFKETL